MLDHPDNALYVTWEQIHQDARNLARQLSEFASFERLVSIARGGLVPAAIIAQELDIRFIDTLCVRSYTNEKKQSDLHILKSVAAAFERDGGDGTLIIDDLVDTGITAQKAKKIMPQAHMATLYAKPLGKSFTDNFVEEVSQSTWIYFPWDKA